MSTPEEKQNCICGENYSGAVHRTDGPCYLKERPTGATYSIGITEEDLKRLGLKPEEKQIWPGSCTVCGYEARNGHGLSCKFYRPMPPPGQLQSESWEEEYVKRLEYNSHDFGEMGKFIRLEYAINILKNFIRSEIQKAYQEGYEKGREEETEAWHKIANYFIPSKKECGCAKENCHRGGGSGTDCPDIPCECPCHK